MADKGVRIDPGQEELPLEKKLQRERERQPVPVQPWQYDLVSSVILNAGTLGIVAFTWWGLEWILSQTGFMGNWAIITARIMFGVAFVGTIGISVAVDMVRFVLRQMERIKEDK